MKIQTLFLVSIIGFFCNGVFADVTGICKDGTETSGTNKRSACRGHDGIKEWYGDKSASSKSDSDTKSESKSKSKKSKAKEEKVATEEAAGPATGVCKDGYVTSGTNKRSACRGHDGIKEWYADKDKEAPAEKSSKAKSKSEGDKTSAANGPVTGICKDGFETSGTNKRSACRGHDGIKEWYADKEKAAPADKEPAAEKSTKAKADEPAVGAATGLCNDGTEYAGASKRGACRGHKGLKEWYADSEEKDDQLAEPPAKTEPAAKKTDTAEPPVRKVQKAPPAGSGQVWVNTKSKIYHCEDSRFYGKTIHGEYMSEKEAAQQGYRANRNKTCN